MNPKSPLPVVLEETLVERACAGDRLAIDAVLVALQRPFYNLALRMLGDRTLAEDATQEALLRVVTHLSEFRGEAKLSTWATRVAIHSILDFRNGIARAARIDFESFAQGLAEGRDPSAIERPEDALLLKQLKTMCGRGLLHCLDGDHRAAFVLGEILELEGDEAAEVLSITPAAFRKRLSRARAELTAFLSRECSVHTEGNPCACHRRLDRAKAIGRIDPKRLETTIGDLMQLRRRLVVLEDDARTTEYYRSDEIPELRAEVMESVRRTLFRVTALPGGAS